MKYNVSMQTYDSMLHYVTQNVIAFKKKTKLVNFNRPMSHLFCMQYI